MPRLLVLLALLVLLVFARPAPAAACSLASIFPLNLADTASRSEIVVIGTLRNGARDAIDIEVEEWLKGSRPSLWLRLNNRYPGLGADCSIYQDATLPGQRFSEGARVLVFLVHDESGIADWRPEYFGNAIFRIEEDGLFGMNPTYPGWTPTNEKPTGSLAELRAQFPPTPASQDPAAANRAPREGVPAVATNDGPGNGVPVVAGVIVVLASGIALALVGLKLLIRRAPTPNDP